MKFKIHFIRMPQYSIVDEENFCDNIFSSPDVNRSDNFYIAITFRELFIYKSIRMSIVFAGHYNNIKFLK